MGALAVIAAILYSESVPADFYGVCAQINPVFVVALLLDQRLADRLGGTVREYEKQALAAWEDIPDAVMVDPRKRPPAARHQVQTWRRRFPEFVWLEKL